MGTKSKTGTDATVKPSTKASQTSQAVKKTIQQSKAKFGAPLINAGWTLLPNIIITHQVDLGLSAQDINILLVLMSFWWTADNLPFPSKKKIANMIGCDESTVRKRIQQMEEKGIIQRIERRVENDRNESNRYDFTGLIKKATPYAEEYLVQQRRVRLAKKRADASKKAPKAVAGAK